MTNENTATATEETATEETATAAGYTPSIVAKMREVYGAAETEAERDSAVATLADTFGFKRASIIQKLVREGVYIAKTRKNKNGGPAETKADIAEDVARLLDVDFAKVDSLANATKSALKVVRDALELRDAEAAAEDAD